MPFNANELDHIDIEKTVYEAFEYATVDDEAANDKGEPVVVVVSHGAVGTDPTGPQTLVTKLEKGAGNCPL